jgi:mevalonate kinase
MIQEPLHNTGDATEGHSCGKVILFGEHAVVHGVSALAGGIDRGVRARASALAEGASRLTIDSWKVTVTPSDTEMLAQAFRALLEASGFGQRPMFVKADVDLPPGAGLGCSAAVGVAVARALDPSAESDVICDRVMAWERVFHGNPSGIDGAVAARGGCVLFRKGQPITEVKLPAAMYLCVGHSGESSSTKLMVESVSHQRDSKPQLVQKTFDGIAAIVANAKLALEAGDSKAVGQLMDMNQMLLAGLQLSTIRIETLCDIARKHGALGSKLTGAGGGGCVIALTDSQPATLPILAAWRDAGFESFAATVQAAFGAPAPVVGPMPSSTNVTADLAPSELDEDSHSF